MNEKAVNDFENGRAWAIRIGVAVYIGVVLLFLAFYETLMVRQFAGNAVFVWIARVGSLLVSANSIALPLAMHFWTVARSHKITAIVFYAGDIILMALNVLSAVDSAAMPAWVIAYRAYAPASIIYVLFGWAMLFITDPGQRALVDLQESILAAQITILKRVNEHLQSDEGVAKVITPVSQKLAARIFNERKLIGEHRPLPANLDDNRHDEINELKKMVADLMSQANSRVTPNPGSDTKPDDSDTMDPLEVTPFLVPLEGTPAPAPFGRNGRG